MKSVMVPGVGEGLLLDTTPDPGVSPEEELRQREVAKLGFPVWVTDPQARAIDHKVSPIVAYLARTLSISPLGLGVEELPKLRAMMPKLEGTWVPDRRVHSGRELRRLLCVADHTVRKFLPAAMTSKGGAQAARMLRDLPAVATFADLSRANRCIAGLAQETMPHANRAQEDEDFFVLMNAIGFSGAFCTSFLELLRAFAEALAPGPSGTTPTGEPEAPQGMGLRLNTTGTPVQPPKPTGDVIDLDGGVVLDLLNYSCSVYGAARVLAEHSLGGKGARIEVDQMGLACLVATLDPASSRSRPAHT